jgi:hypothetical protein
MLLLNTLILEDLMKNLKCSCSYCRYPCRFSNPESLKYETRTSQDSLTRENFVTTNGSPPLYNGMNFCRLLPLPALTEVKFRLCGPGSSVGIATAYGLDGPGIETRWGQVFLHLS